MLPKNKLILSHGFNETYYDNFYNINTILTWLYKQNFEKCSYSCKFTYHSELTNGKLLLDFSKNELEISFDKNISFKLYFSTIKNKKYVLGFNFINAALSKDKYIDFNDLILLTQHVLLDYMADVYRQLKCVSNVDFSAFIYIACNLIVNDILDMRLVTEYQSNNYTVDCRNNKFIIINNNDSLNKLVAVINFNPPTGDIISINLYDDNFNYIDFLHCWFFKKMYPMIKLDKLKLGFSSTDTVKNKAAFDFISNTINCHSKKLFKNNFTFSNADKILVGTKETDTTNNKTKLVWHIKDNTIQGCITINLNVYSEIESFDVEIPAVIKMLPTGIETNTTNVYQLFEIVSSILN